MKNSKINLKNLKIFISFLFIFFVSYSINANDNLFEIKGNNFTDTNVILSLLKDIPENLDEEYSNEIIKILNTSNLFSELSVKFIDNKYIIIVKEFPNIDKLYFKNNERLDDEELQAIAFQSNLITFNLQSINQFINDTKQLYESFGYNDVQIQYSEKIYKDTNTVAIYFEIEEGKITKIKNIFINGNNYILAQDIREIIKSKTKTIKNIFANNNYKPATVEKDKIIIKNYYKNNGYLNANVDTKIEYLKTNEVNIYFNITEGDIYLLSSITFNDQNNLLNTQSRDLVQKKIDNFLIEKNYFSPQKIRILKDEISSIILDNDIEFFEINISDKVDKKNVEIFFEILSIKPKYTKQINIIGNSRTYDRIIRRELDIIEGDAVYKTQLQNIREKLISLNLFESVKVKEEIIDEENVNIIIEVEEKQTGTFNAGISVGTIDGFAIVTGLRERNFYGTGRSVDVLINTSEDRSQFKFITTDRLSYENEADISYSINYKEEDFSKASSYNLDTFSSGIGVGYKLNKNIFHNIDLEYVLKDYQITNSSTVSNSILNSSGVSMSYLIKNNLRYSTLNPGFISKSGNFINFNNTIETPTSSSNGFVRNIITFKKFTGINNNILSIQTKIGNIFSLNNKDILTDNKFALGGRWLRGFDSYGAGPRNSRTSYVGGNNLVVTKFDYSYELSKNSPTNSDNSLRSSAGFGVKYYSPIGPIGLTWGFPIMHEEYDIKRMFLFSIGNIDWDLFI